MPVSTLPSAQDFEEKAHAEVEFVGFRYIGERSMLTDHDVRQRVGYNGPAKFQQGRVYLALLPTYLDDEHIENANMGVHAIEARSDFEVIYDRATLAEALLGRNYLPPDIFYEGFDRYKREKVMAKLDLSDHGRIFEKDDETPYREELREIAGIERDSEASVSQQRTDGYIDRFSRSEAQAVVGVLQGDTDVVDVEAAGLTDMASYLTRYDPSAVEDAADVALGETPREDVDLPDPVDAVEDDDALVGGFDPGEHTVDEVREHVQSIDGDDIVAELEALREAEANGEDRTTALEAIDSRLNDRTE